MVPSLEIKRYRRNWISDFDGPKMLRELSGDICHDRHVRGLRTAEKRRQL